MTNFIRRAVFLFVFLLSCNTDKEIEAGLEQETCIDAGVDAGSDTEITNEETITKEQLESEVVWAWNTIFNDVGAWYKDKRRKMFPIYARMLINNLELIRNQEIPEDVIEHKFPNGRWDHILLAVMAYEESSIKPKVVGRSNEEVGLFQLHSAALQGYSSKEVQYNTELGIFLGLKWTAGAIAICSAYNPSLLDNWDLNSWLGPLAVYGGGERRAIKNGKCVTNWKFAKERVNMTKNLVARLLAQEE